MTNLLRFSGLTMALHTDGLQLGGPDVQTIMLRDRAFVAAFVIDRGQHVGHLGDVDVFAHALGLALGCRGRRRPDIRVEFDVVDREMHWLLRPLAPADAG